jgi:hypothetical protein
MKLKQKSNILAAVVRETVARIRLPGASKNLGACLVRDPLRVAKWYFVVGRRRRRGRGSTASTAEGRDDRRAY